MDTVQLCPRQLKPWALSARLRPVNLHGLRWYLQDYDRLAQALGLYRDYLPDDLERFRDDVADLDWLDALTRFIDLIEDADWLPVDHAALDWAWNCIYDADPEDEGLAMMARYLKEIPLQLYGVNPQDPDYPPLSLLRALLADEATPVQATLLIEAELYDGLEAWSAADRRRLWARLRDIETQPHQFPEPLRWLPAWGRWACGSAGNLLLDNAPDPQRQGRCFTWAELKKVRWCWQRAKPIIQFFEKHFMAWYDEDPSRLAYVVQFLMEGNYDQLNW